MANYTLNYTGEKVDELLNKIDTAFGETTVMGDTLTWDGDMTGRVYVEMEMPIDDEGNMTTMQYVKVSDSIPTFEELQNGGSLGAPGQTIPFPPDEEAGTGEKVVDIGSVIMIGQNVLIAKEDNADMSDTFGFILPEKGVYFGSAPAMSIYVDAFTINNYTGFETVEVKTIDPKYLPTVDIVFNITSETFYQEPTKCAVTCNKTFEELQGMSEKELLDARIVWTATDVGVRTEFRPLTASNTEGIGLFFINTIVTAVYMYQLYYTADTLAFARVG